MPFEIDFGMHDIPEEEKKNLKYPVILSDTGITSKDLSLILWQPDRLVVLNVSL